MRARCAPNSSLITWAMLRFRPIAPKPSTGEPISPVEERAVKNRKRTKRKYVRVCDRRQTPKGKRRESIGRPLPPENSGVEDGSSPGEGVVTLQQMPVRSESNKSCGDNDAGKITRQEKNNSDSTDHDEVNRQVANVFTCGSFMADAAGSVRSVIKTWIFVECVTDALADDRGVGLGFTDWEKINKLQSDTCPGFVSDGTNKVVWVNEAYRKMVGQQHGIMIWLALKEELPKYNPSFACRVRMSEQTTEGRVWNRVVACDVWRMEFAGFAWKLDITTALGLA